MLISLLHLTFSLGNKGGICHSVYFLFFKETTVVHVIDFGEKRWAVGIFQLPCCLYDSRILGVAAVVLIRICIIYLLYMGHWL